MNHMFLLKVLFAAVLGIVLGLFLPANAEILGIPLIGIYNLFGQLFLRALTIIVVPLVIASIITGTMRIGADHSLGRLGSKIFLSFILTMACAVAIGMASILIFEPGKGVISQEALSTQLTQLHSVPINEAGWNKIEQIFFRIVPINVFAAASQGEIIGIILFTALFGLFSAELGGNTLITMKAFWEATFKVLIRMTQWIMAFLPLGVFGLIAKAAATAGAGAILSVGTFALTVMIALFFYAFILWPIVLWLVGRVNPWKHLKAMAPALLTGFTTSSSAATLPVALECIEKGSGVSNRVSSLVLPLGIAVNLSGSALYSAAVVAFIAQLTGITLDIGSISFMYVVSLLTCFGMAGVPSASLIAIILILQTLNIPNDQLAIIMAIERFVDMARTAVNVFGNSCCALIVARLEGEKTNV